MVKKPNIGTTAATSQKLRARNLALIKRFSVVIVVAAAFAGGFAVRGDDAILSVVGLGALASDPASAMKAQSSSDSYNSLGYRVGEVERVINDESLDTFDIGPATTKTLDALASATNDPYFRYYDASRYASLVKDNSEDYAGVGVLFSEYEGRAYAVDVFEGSAAQASDVRTGDFVVAVDGDRSHDWTGTEVTSALERAAGQDVVITWRRTASLDDTGGKEFTTTLPCESSTVKNVTTELYDKVGYIQLKQITNNAAQLVRQAVADLDAQGASSYVLDVRDNPGGYLTQAVDVASLFVKSGAIVRVQTKGTDVNTKNATGDSVTDKPLVVLVNGNTSSSAEVLAAALHDNQRATLVGQKTLGKGSVQVTRELSFGGAIRYTAAYYKSPLGHDIDGAGVVPDVSVGLSDGDDNQKALALETAQSSVVQ